MEDIKLLWLLHQNPSAGMEQLMNQYLGLVYAVVKGKLLDSVCPSSDVEDCVTDVFSELKKSGCTRKNASAFWSVIHDEFKKI